MNEHTTKCLYDILLAGKAVVSFATGKTYEDFLRDEMLRSAVERKFEIIGEALTRIRDFDLDIFEKIDLSHEIVGMRNRLIHGYDSVDEEIVWETVNDHLPKLLGQIEGFLRNSSDFNND